MFWVGAAVVALSGCISQQQINGTVRVQRDSFRGTAVVRAEMLMRSAERNAEVVVSGERGADFVLLSLRVGSDIRSPLATCFIEAASGTQVLSLPRPTHRMEPIGGGFSLAHEHFVVPLTLDQAELLFRGIPRFRVCSSAFLPTREQIETFHQFWDEFAPATLTPARAN